MKSRVEHIDQELAADPTNTNYLTEKVFVDEVCSKHGDSGHAAPDNASHADLDLNGDKLHHYLEDLAEPCGDMMIRLGKELTVHFGYE
jgi:hypothetical protein